MSKKASQSQLMIPFRAALDAGYTHLYMAEEIKTRIKALGRPSFENVKMLHQLGVDFLDMLTDAMERSAKILALAKDWQLLAEIASGQVLPREILDHISIQLLLHHLRDSTIIDAKPLKKLISNDPARQQYDREMREFISLLEALWAHKIDATRILATTISDQRIYFAQHWQDWMNIHDLLRKKATAYKRSYVSLKNKSSGLLPDKVRSILVDECNCLCQICDNAINAELVKKYNSIYRYGRPIRSNSKVWNPLLKDLEKQLSRAFKPIRHWETPGGYKQKATASRVYDYINRILYFCYPSIWAHNKKTTATIKSRCHRTSTT